MPSKEEDRTKRKTDHRSDNFTDRTDGRTCTRHASISIVQAMQDEEAKAVGERERLMAEFWNLKMKG
jgi:hypothetical protein